MKKKKARFGPSLNPIPRSTISSLGLQSVTATLRTPLLLASRLKPPPAGPAGRPPPPSRYQLLHPVPPHAVSAAAVARCTLIFFRFQGRVNQPPKLNGGQ
ncbi:unnamed protein product [Citrullus colocynthis]|uniref:Uncharacterized protein n=1 Tax=Citrullus colocynthis TaxID=252529 RepID=A0ABP0YUB5_9ROSI